MGKDVGLCFVIYSFSENKVNWNSKLLSW